MSDDETTSIRILPFWRAHRLIRRKIAAAAKKAGADPAPWFSPVDEQDFLSAADRPDLAASAERLTALLSGSLSGYGSVDGEWLPAPSWHWQGMHPKTMLQRWPSRLPSEWDRWRGIVVHHLDRCEFWEWLKGLEPSFPEELALPEPTEPMPQFDARRELPQTGTVTLSEAVSWAAWSFALPGYEMMAAVDAGEFGADATRQLKIGFDLFLAKARAGEMVLWGRFSSAYDNATSSRQLTVGDLLDFARLNPLDESLERGEGYAWEGLSLDAVLSGDGSKFMEVRVAREEVIAAFPSPGGVNGYAVTAMPPRRPRSNGRRPTPQQQEAFRFFDFAAGDKRLRDLTQESLFTAYKELFTTQKLRGEPFAFSRFKEMLVRHRCGERVENGRWTEKTD